MESRMIVDFVKLIYIWKLYFVIALCYISDAEIDLFSFFFFF